MQPSYTKIYETIVGSVAYGLNIEGKSDQDVKGVAIPNINHILGLHPFEQHEITVDYVIYSLQKFVKLAATANPTILECLFTNESDILYAHPLGKKLRDNRDLFLSTKVKHSFSGYAYSQILRLKNHHRWINNPQVQPKQEDYYITKYRMVNNVSTPHTAFIENEYDAAYKKWVQYETWKKERNPERSKLEEFYGFDCYSSDTEFLTDSGFLPFDSITSDHKLATVRSRDRKLFYQNYTEKFSGSFTGNLYNFTGHHNDILVTPNHKMLIRELKNVGYTGSIKGSVGGKWELRQASNLPHHFKFLNTIKPFGFSKKKPKEYNNEVREKLNVTLLNYLKVMGWFISEGSCEFRDGKIKSISVSQSKPQSRLTQTLTRLINTKSLFCNKYTGKTIREGKNFLENTWTFTGDIAHKLYGDCGHGSYNKRIPEWVFNLTKRHLGSLLTALLQGDGTKKHHQSGTFVYYTVSSKLADDVQRLAFLCGYKAAKWGPYKNVNNFGGDDFMLYQVFIHKNAPPEKAYARYLNIDKIPVTEHKIVCFTVPNSILVTRRNGKIAIQGNSKFAMHAIRLLKQGLECLRDGVVNVKRVKDREELLGIRNGKMSYEDLIKYADDLMKQLDEAYDKSPLPREVDMNKIEDLLIDIQSEFYGVKI